ncbi:MAG: hypothetical protein PF508_08315 [Spirochaeta sp.]|nr:hypothetical protein [Spirochaeta sp.]
MNSTDTVTTDLGQQIKRSRRSGMETVPQSVPYFLAVRKQVLKKRANYIPTMRAVAREEGKG